MSLPALLPVIQSLCVSADPGMPRGTCLSPLSPPLWLCPFPLSLLEAAACLFGDLPHCSASILAPGHHKINGGVEKLAVLNYLLIWEGVRSPHPLHPSAVCDRCLKRSLLSVFLLEVRKTIFQSTLPLFLGILLNLRRCLRNSWSGETSPDLENNKPRGGKGGRILLETSLGSWRLSRDACLIFL